MDSLISFAILNDFIFCPASIYYHGFYDGVDQLVYNADKQMGGLYAHSKIDNNEWTQSNVLCSLSVESVKYGIYGKIDKYYPCEKLLVESKKKINKVYDGYIFQLYAQYYGMIEAGYEVNKLVLYSISDHKKYPVELPSNNFEMLNKFEGTIDSLRNFNIQDFEPDNIEKCKNCIYSDACQWGNSSL